MELLQRIFVLLLLARASFSTLVTLEGGQTGVVVKEVSTDTAEVVLSCSISFTVVGGTTSVEWTLSKDPDHEGRHIYYNGFIVGDSSKYTFLSPYSLGIKNVVPDDEGYYKCRAVIPGDTPSAASAQYNLVVLVGPYDQISCGFPEDHILTIGQSAEFRCAEVIAQAKPPPVFKWFKDDEELPLNSSHDKASYPDSYFSYSTETGILKFQEVSYQDKGNYYCTATNKVKSASCPAANIMTTLRVTLEDDQTGIVSKEVIINASVTLVCGVSAPNPFFEWSRSENLSSEEYFIYRNEQMSVNGSKYVLEPPYSLVVNDLTLDDSGFYKCKAVLPMDSAIDGSATYNLTVFAPPASLILCDFPDTLKLEVGTSAEFFCKENVKQAYPAPVYKWFKDNRELPMSSADDTLYANSSFTCNTETGVLEFATVAEGDAGNYYCSASNGFGSEQCMQKTIGIGSHSEHPALSSMLVCLCDAAIFLIVHKLLA